MCISGTEPSSVILIQTKKFQNLESKVTKVSKQAEAKRDEAAKAKSQKQKVNLCTVRSLVGACLIK